MERENLWFLHQLTMLIFVIFGIYLAVIRAPLLVALGTAFLMVATQIFLLRFQEDDQQEDEPHEESDQVLAPLGSGRRMVAPFIIASSLVVVVSAHIATGGAPRARVFADALFTAVILILLFYFERRPPSTPPPRPQNVEQNLAQLRTEFRLRLMCPPTSRKATFKKERTRRSWHGDESVSSLEYEDSSHRRRSASV